MSREEMLESERQPVVQQLQHEKMENRAKGEPRGRSGTLYWQCDSVCCWSKDALWG